MRKLSPGYNTRTKLIMEVLNFEAFKDKNLWIKSVTDDTSDKRLQVKWWRNICKNVGLAVDLSFFIIILFCFRVGKKRSEKIDIFLLFPFFNFSLKRIKTRSGVFMRMMTAFRLLLFGSYQFSRSILIHVFSSPTYMCNTNNN